MEADDFNGSLPLQGRKISSNRTWYSTGYEFIVGDSIEYGKKTLGVNRVVLMAVNAQIESFKEKARKEVKSRNRSPRVWTVATEGHECICAVFEGDEDDDDVETEPETACRCCIERGVPCTVAYFDRTPIVLPLPVELRSGGPMELGYYVRK